MLHQATYDSKDVVDQILLLLRSSSYLTASTIQQDQRELRANIVAVCLRKIRRPSLEPHRQPGDRMEAVARAWAIFLDIRSRALPPLPETAPRYWLGIALSSFNPSKNP